MSSVFSRPKQKQKNKKKKQKNKKTGHKNAKKSLRKHDSVETIDLTSDKPLKKKGLFSFYVFGFLFETWCFCLS